MKRRDYMTRRQARLQLRRAHFTAFGASGVRSIDPPRRPTRAKGWRKAQGRK
jgi:hypothetical protein